MSDHFSTTTGANHSTGFIAALVATGAAAVAVVVTVLVLTIAGHGIGAHSATSTPTPGASAAAAVHPASRPTPSAAVKTLQQQLGQLNYYEGPVDGLTGPQTIHAIQYLQRDAGLPQTGQMNAATQTALAHFLATGNNQMGS
jgi:Putative peptidoglycan binding domain